MGIVFYLGVVGADVSGVGTARDAIAACEYGEDKGIFAFGSNGNISNLVSNVGVVASDGTGVGTGRNYPGACSYA